MSSLSSELTKRVIPRLLLKLGKNEKDSENCCMELFSNPRSPIEQCSTCRTTINTGGGGSIFAVWSHTWGSVGGGVLQKFDQHSVCLFGENFLDACRIAESLTSPARSSALVENRHSFAMLLFLPAMLRQSHFDPDFTI